MCVLIFSTNLYETFLILRRNEQDMIIILMVLEFYGKIFKKILKYKIL